MDTTAKTKDAIANRRLDVPHQRLLTLIRDLAYERRDFTLSSGQKSNFYIDCRRVTLDPEGAFLTGMLINAAIRELAPTARGVGGMTMGADPIATATSITSYHGGHPLYAFYVRKEAKGHGTNRLVEAPPGLGKGSEVILVEDVVTTGNSTVRAFEAVREFGFTVLTILSMVDRSEGGAERVSKLAPYYSLFRREDIVD